MIYLLLTPILIGVAISTMILLSLKKELRSGCCGDKCSCKKDFDLSSKKIIQELEKNKLV